MSKPPFAKINFGRAAVDVSSFEDGSMVLRAAQRLEPYPRSVGAMLEHWARETPEQTFLAERAGDGWRRISYADTLSAVRSIAQAFLNRRLSAERPVAILSDNSIDHALVALGAMHAGIPVAPISASYSLLSTDYGKLKHTLGLVAPGLIFVANGAPFTAALNAVDLGGAELVVGANPPEGVPATLLAELMQTTATAEVDDALNRIGPDTTAKILFTSGSTGMPKGVINTHGMLCSNQQSLTQLWPFLSEKPPVIVDWLPWNHVFGGNFCFNMMLRHGGSIYIDDGKATPQLIKKTVANLREISPTIYFNVPRGYDMLLPYLEQDEELRNSFFKNLDLIFYAAAALPPHLWTRLEDVAVTALGKRVPMVSGWGSTETSPLITVVNYPIDRSGVIGLPIPGCQIKMVPNFGKMEMRIRGPNITPGYYKRDDLTRKEFDEEGWYCIGDAGKLADPDHPELGIEFDGRVSEDFKLLSGTWVSVGSVRLKAISTGTPVIQDAVVTGHDREEIGLLVFPSEEGCRSLCPDAPADATLAELIRDSRVRNHVAITLKKLVAESTGSSTRPTRMLLMEELPSIDANEITDKGYINQRGVLARRVALVERLYADAAAGDVIVCERGKKTSA
ncbi:MAG: feruloyl-CoA synthase [Gammaproteobacteria bacterium]|nr:feruloyl-CoA synthase [Gammaproteobacteria bacterium]MCP5458263.1 feruloyl-CoA synthase [Gammaproteobacteria bacterium]